MEPSRAAGHGTEPIAIVGIGCRFPGGVDGAPSYWQLMRDGVDAMVDVPRDRWDVRRFYSPDPARPGKMYVRQAGFLRQSIDTFDASFFAMSPREAARLDPQQRLLLEVAWEALEDAGLSQERLQSSNTGVFVGGFMIDSYLTALSRENRELIDAHTATGIGQTMLSARIAYLLDLRGPALTVDTACSSSLVAVHYACESLRSGECTTALVGGVNVIFFPNVMIGLCKAGLLSPDARCHAFDARANGYARGEGAGMVVLRPLSIALAEGDAIYAVIRGSGVNQDGRSEGSITAPNRAAQEQLLATVYARAGVHPSEVQYVEAHGTGTAVGDATEAGALGRVLGAGRAGGPCFMGSVKTNIGHLEGAAGVAGLIKAALALQRRQIPPNLHYERPNPAIPFAELALRVPVALEPWPATAGSRYAGVNSFGYGGTNAHVVLEEAPPASERPDAPAEATGMCLVPISARSESALRALVLAYLRRLETPGELRFDDLQHTLALRRSHHDFRLVALCPPRLEELRAQLAAYASGGTAPGLWTGTRRAGRPPRIAWVLSGMGPQWWAMGRELLEAEPLFRDVVARCDRELRVLCGWSLLDELNADEERSRMHATEVSQPANFALQMGLAAIWRSWGIEPDAVVGHSTGEVAAACIAGALSFEDGVRVAYHRGRVLAMAAGKGGMLAVQLGASELAPFLDGYEAQVSIAAINAPRSCTIAGDSAALQEIAHLLEKHEVFHRPLRVEVPYHSPALDRLRGELRAALDGMAPRAPIIPLISSVTAEPVSAAIHDAEYWCRNIRDVVRFSDSIDRLLADGVDTFVEIGPHPVLSQSIAECAVRAGRRGEIVHSLQRGKPEKDTLLAGLARLVAHGATPDWSRLVSTGAGFVRLPSYPWQRERHWVESEGSLTDRLGADQHPLLGARTDSPSPQWRSEIDLSRLEYLADHAIQGEPVYPAAAHLEGAIAMAKELRGPGPCVLRNVALHRALGLRDGRDTLLHSSFDPRRESFTIHGQTGGGPRGGWSLLASGEAPRPDRSPAPPPANVVALRHGAEEIPPAELYRRLAARGYDYGPAFRLVQRCFVGSGDARCEVRVPPAMAAPAAPYTIHPAVLDACFHSLLSAMPSEGVAPAGVAYLPVRIGRLLLGAPLEASLWCHARILRCDDQQLEGSIRVYGESGATVLEMDGISARALARPPSLAARPYAGWLYRFEWEKVERPTALAAEERSWIVLGSDDGLGATLAAALGEEGERAEATHVGAIGDLLPAVVDRDGRCHVVYLTRAASVAGDARPAAPPDDTAIESSLDVVRLVQALAGAPWRTTPRLVLITRTAARVAASDRRVLPGESALQGLARVILTEHPELGCKLIDLAGDFVEPHALVREVTAGDDHDEEVALRGAARFAPRLHRVDADELARRTVHAHSASTAFRLGVAAAPSGTPHVKAHEHPRRTPQAREVEVEIDAALPAPSAEGQLRIAACTGRVAAVGDGVVDFAAGDEVFGIGSDGSCSHVTLSAHRAVRLAKGSSREEATGVFALVAAYHALAGLARIGPGTRVLAYPAGDGIDPALHQVARACGAELTFAGVEEDERGFDVVIGRGAELVERARGLLAPGGCSVELSAGDGDAPLERAAPRPNTGHLIANVSALASEQPAELGRLLRVVQQLVERGTLRPPTIGVIPAGSAGELLVHGARSAMFGATAIGMRDQELEIELAPRTGPLFRADATFLVTGGLGGFGLTLASWMVDHGARHLVLAGRRGVTSPAAAEAVAALERRGADVVVARTDVSNRAQVAGLIGEIARRGYPLRGVFHAAANLDPGADGFLLQLTEGKVRSMMDPKVRGAWNLHLETLELPLDYFVLFSSVAALFGFQGLGAYAASNAFLDGLSHMRRAHGLTALSVDWGAVKDVGVLARLEEHQRAGELSGAEGVPAKDLLEALEPLLAGSQAQIAVGKHAWNTWTRAHPTSARSRRFSDPALRPASAAPGGAGAPAFRDVILALEPAERRGALIDHLRGVSAVLLGAAPERVDADTPLDQLGLTSLTAAQLKASLDADLGVTMPLMTLLAEAVTVAQLADRALAHLGRSAPRTAAGGAPAARGAGVDALAAGIAESEPMHMRAPSDSGTLHVARWTSREPGNRPPLVIVHGLWEEGRLWEHVAARLAQHRQVFLVDLRGHGESAKLPTGYHPDDHARDLEGVLALVGAPQVDLLAFCIGATAATKVAARNPPRVRRLILQEPWNGHLDRERMRMLCALKQQSAETVRGTLRELFPTRPGWAIEKLTQALRRTADAVFNAAIDSPEELFDQSSVLGAVKVPTLLLRADPARGGEMDEPFCAQLLGTLHAAELVDFPDTSRAIQVERPHALVEQVERFLGNDT